MFGRVPYGIESGQEGKTQHGDESTDHCESGIDTFPCVEIRGESALVSEKTLDGERDDKTRSGDAAYDDE